MSHEKFNDCKHQFVTLDEGKETVSILTKSGKRITVCVMEGVADCVDICYFDSKQPKSDEGNPRFTVIGFDQGRTPVPHTDVTLFTILLK